MKLYHLAVIKKDNTQKRLTGYAMTHGECETMKSKFTNEEQARIIFEDAGPCTHAAGFWQFEGDMRCRTCGENQDWINRALVESFAPPSKIPADESSSFYPPVKSLFLNR